MKLVDQTAFNVRRSPSPSLSTLSLSLSQLNHRLNQCQSAVLPGSTIQTAIKTFSNPHFSKVRSPCRRLAFLGILLALLVLGARSTASRRDPTARRRQWRRVRHHSRAIPYNNARSHWLHLIVFILNRLLFLFSSFYLSHTDAAILHFSFFG